MTLAVKLDVGRIEKSLEQRGGAQEQQPTMMRSKQRYYEDAQLMGRLLAHAILRKNNWFPPKKPLPEKVRGDLIAQIDPLVFGPPDYKRVSQILSRAMLRISEDSPAQLSLGMGVNVDPQTLSRRLSEFTTYLSWASVHNPREAEVLLAQIGISALTRIIGISSEE